MILVLYFRKFLHESDLHRLFELSRHFDSSSDRPLPPFEEVWEVISSAASSDSASRLISDLNDSDKAPKAPWIE